MSQFHQLKVNKINKVTDKAVEILFEIPENLRSEFKFIAGQYITISTNLNNEEVRRAYSLCSDPSSGEIAVGVKRVERGIMSTFLTQELKVGDTLDVMTPKGTFCLTNERKVVGICAGSGITPILSMIKSDSADFTLVYGNKTESSGMFLEEINNMNISKYLTFSREYVDGCLNSRIDKKMLEELSKNESFLNADGYFICGPGEMIDFVEEFLLEKGVDKTKIHFENINQSNSQNYKSLIGNFKIENVDGTSEILKPELRIYNQPNIVRSEAHI